jgi:cell division protein FtsL
MSSFSQTFLSSYKKTRSFSVAIGRHFAVFNVVVFLCVLAVGLMYIVQINLAATQGYAIRDLETQISQLERDNKAMQMQASEARSLERVARGVKMLGMVKSDGALFVSSDAPSVAVNR